MNYPKRKNHRLQQYDYGKSGYYYITICTLNRKAILCDITPTTVGSHALVAPLVTATAIGNMVTESFFKIETMNNHIKIDKFVLMPNHIHAIIVIENKDEIEIPQKKYAFEITERRGRRSLQGLIKDFKSVTTRIYKKETGSQSSLWQESFYDEIIENEAHYRNIWNYIDTNPLKWADDCYYSK